MKKKLLLAVMMGWVTCLSAQQTLDLSGVWRFQTDPMGFGKTPGSELYLARLTENIQLPGTTDEGGKGIRTTARYVDRLTRKFEYCGPAWYQREIVIPDEWKGKDVWLNLERCHWETTVYLDGRPIGTDERLSTPNRFCLGEHAKPGIHVLTICVDNRLKYPMDQWNHGTTEYTQTNWNGMVGNLYLEAREKAHIAQLKIYPDLEKRTARLDITLHNGYEQPVDGILRLEVKEKDGKMIGEKELPVQLASGDKTINHSVALGEKVKLWDEFNPYLYEVNVVFRSKAGGDDTRHATFGMRHVEQGKHHVRLNGRDIHLRGALDCCVFPLTGYPSTRTEDWLHIFRTVKDYGMNHIRFHSWCPPEAAFCAADEIGIYLQVELPMWIKDVGQYPERRDFFEKEMYAILDEYGNHPSFLLMCNGNENEGDFAVLEDLVKKARQYDDRHLYSASTARTHTASDQYYVSHVTEKGWITVYEGKPSTNWDRSAESGIDCPVIAHETGQRCMYPDFREMEKYTGVVMPRNFEVFRERLACNGMLHQANDFFRATGAHTVLQYKEVNESLLRTPNSGGFQLLGLADFPGQGSAFVGILDAFWESKGLVTSEKYRESCGPTVLLARLPRRAFTNNEVCAVRMDIYHYGERPLKRGNVEWELKNSDGHAVRRGTFRIPDIACATVDSLGSIRLDFSDIDRADKLTLHATLNGTYHNEWNIWVYPKQQNTVEGDYLYARKYDEEVRTALAQGRKVLLVPQDAPGRKTRFASHFWNPIMFNWAPMIVGTLIDEDHPAFRLFPTDSYADWQWWDILNHAVAMEIGDLSRLTPVIQSIDTYEENRKLGIAFEAKVGNGSLFVLCADTEKDIENRPAMRQLLHSVGSYVASDEFSPACEVKMHQLDRLFEPKEHSQQEENEAIKLLLNR